MMTNAGKLYGRNSSGGDRSYGGHYVALHGVNIAGTSSNLHDPGSNEVRDILTITREKPCVTP